MWETSQERARNTHYTSWGSLRIDRIIRLATWADKNEVRKDSRCVYWSPGSGDTHSPWGHHHAARTQLLEDEYGFTVWGKIPGTIVAVLGRKVHTYQKLTYHGGVVETSGKSAYLETLHSWRDCEATRIHSRKTYITPVFMTYCSVRHDTRKGQRLIILKTKLWVFTMLDTHGDRATKTRYLPGGTRVPNPLD